jgi:hypothetical protein
LAWSLDVFVVLTPLEAVGVGELELCVVDRLGVLVGAGADAWWLLVLCVVLELPPLVGGAEPPGVVVVGSQLATTLWTGGVPGGSIAAGAVPAAASTVKVIVEPLSSVAVTVH